MGHPVLLSICHSRFHVRDDPVHVVPDGSEDGRDADSALFGAEGDDAGEVHGAVDAAVAGDEGTAAVAVARIPVWKEEKVRNRAVANPQNQDP